MIYYTRAAAYLAQKISCVRGAYELVTFPDGEITIKLLDDVFGQRVLVIGSTFAPAEHTLEFIMLIHALHIAGASVHVLVLYMGYARQDLGAQVVARLLASTQVACWSAIHVHTPHIQTHFKFQDLIPFDFFYQQAIKVDCIVAPDSGSLLLAQKIAYATSKELVYLSKKRKNQSVYMVEIVGHVENKKVLIVDDIVATGATLVAAANILKQHGAQSIQAAVTHGLFVPDALDLLEKSSLNSLLVTDTLGPIVGCSKIEQQSIAGLVQHWTENHLCVFV